MNSKNIDLLYLKLSQNLPNARSELQYRNIFELLNSVILSAQTTDKVINSITPELFFAYPTPQALMKCGVIKLMKIIKPIGLAPTKSKNIINTCQRILEEHGGKIPDSREALEKLPGVGRKTANVVLNEGFGKPTIAVDTHVFRVSNRTGLAKGKTVRETEENLLKITPDKWKKNAHRYLILHGRYVCTAKKFICQYCVIQKECEYPGKK